MNYYDLSIQDWEIYFLLICNLVMIVIYYFLIKKRCLK